MVLFLLDPGRRTRRSGAFPPAGRVPEEITIGIGDLPIRQGLPYCWRHFGVAADDKNNPLWRY